MSFNTFNIKRQAHSLSRQRSDQTWNVFRHVSSPRMQTERRAETWDNAPVLKDDRVGGGIPPTPSILSPIRENQDEDIVRVKVPPSSIPLMLVPVDEERPVTTQGTIDSATGLRKRKDIEELRDNSIGDRREARRFIKRCHPKEPFTVANQIQRIFLRSWTNLLLLCTPIGFVLNYVKGKSVETFVINLIAAIPLLLLNDIALLEISLRVGERVGGLIYIFTANFVQLISCIILVTSHQGHLVQLTLAGGILANLLFVLGLSLLCGGILRRPYQHFHQSVAHVSSNMLSLAATSLLIPTASHLLAEASEENLRKQSRGAAFILIFVYILYLLFQLLTHSKEFEARGEKVPAQLLIEDRGPSIRAGLTQPGIMLASQIVGGEAYTKWDSKRGFEDEKEDEELEPELHFAVAIFTFVVSTVLVFFCVDFVVNSIEALASHANISPTFIGLILLPIPNCDFTAIKMAIYDKLDEAMNCTIGKCLQTALLVTPVVVLIAWGLGVDEVNLVFDGFEVVSLFASILLLNFLMSEGKVSWIQGILLLADWGLIALAAFYATA